ncbi:sensor histidine kinase [Halomicrobium katesii]|uniref:sensor histidine kinase n=1 Tax=Halomicrobium katesii TaxID=437163 RepID=UPI001FDF8CE5|nr:HAMP domain-containing sensor histidine kinase [Halomicrobium katesii]
MLVAMGLVWFAGALWNFQREIASLDGAALPVATFVLTGGLSAGVVFVGYRLTQSPFAPDERWSIVGWTAGGLLVTVSLHAATLSIRAAEGRPIGEPQFPLLVAGGVGALAGYGIGELLVDVRRTAAQAQQARDGTAFANSLLRHDVRNALQVILGQVDVLTTIDDERVGEATKRIESQVEGLYDLTSNAEAVTAVLTGEATPEPRNAIEDIETTVATVTESFPDATVETALHDRLVVRGTDALRPVFGNILDNAVQHTGSNPTVRVTTETADGVARIRFADDGQGIPEAQRSRIFERGVTTDGGSNGLGLHVVSTLVERSDGSIYVEDSELGGAAFVVELPIAE